MDGEKMKDYSLPERVKIITEYWLQGEELLVEGRRMILGPVNEGSPILAVGAIAQAGKFEAGKEPVFEDTIIGVNMSLSKFLLIAQRMTPADINRLEQVIAFKKFEQEMEK
jgi:hypothetical protein